MKKRIALSHEDREFIVKLEDGDKACATVKELVVIFQGKRRRYYDEAIRYIRIEAHPPPKPDPFYEQLIEIARSKL